MWIYYIYYNYGIYLHIMLFLSYFNKKKIYNIHWSDSFRWGSRKFFQQHHDLPSSDFLAPTVPRLALDLTILRVIWPLTSDHQFQNAEETMAVVQRVVGGAGADTATFCRSVQFSGTWGSMLNASQAINAMQRTFIKIPGGWQRRKWMWAGLCQASVIGSQSIQRRPSRTLSTDPE